DRLLLDVIEEATGRRYEKLDAAAQLHDLGLDVDAAEHDGASQRQILAVGADAFLDLGRELARRSEDERAHRVARRGGACIGVPGEPVKQRQRESRGLAGAGLGSAQNVAPLEHQRDRLSLDWRGLGVTLLRDRLEQLRQEI